MKVFRTSRVPFLLALVVLAGCAQPMRRNDSPARAPDREESSRGEVRSAPPGSPAATRKPRKDPPAQPAPPDSEEMPVTPAEPAREETGEIRPAGSLTGVPVCDRYLASFRQCHTTIGQSSPTQIDQRYDSLRDTLTRKSGTPEGRAEISRMCKDFAASVASALGDRKCGDPPG